LGRALPSWPREWPIHPEYFGKIESPFRVRGMSCNWRENVD
jgi:hypothetical protein